ncbi:DNA processing protein [Paraburkholderia youngii]|uniref:DNA processing protein n=1 Tax=Paraburkholderia youngii TaxID=2782701 RepID=A0A7W8L5Q8_9BURK|nr:DNA-processing protein DprA [Paraburkholderia youngii]MBB5400398.1 DNA processing protein [Paraburkholderia youngii]NVI05510.1 DNA-protecting protein DprA [Paraburkholderia youngii]
MHTLPATRIELAAWLRLSLAPGLRPAALRLLLAAFGLPEALFAQSPDALAEVAGEPAARAVLAPPGPAFDGQLEVVLAWREQPGNQIVTLDDPAYPPALLTMPDPPPLLYIKGRLDLLHTRAVALVGSRSATPQGIEDARRFARALSAAGVTVVSGLALGIDGAAHRGGLEGVGGTVAVIGTGADLVYPAAHHALAGQIGTQGAILSEWPLGTPARAANFPQRNRLIAGLVSGVVIVEAAMRSGSLITARLANEMGRDVFALPGSIYAPLSRGCHRMIKQGARLVETPDEVLEELGFVRRTANHAGRAAKQAAPLDQARLRVSSGGTALRAASAAFADTRPIGPAPQPALAPDSQRLLAALGHSPTTLEILAARTEMEDAALHAALLRLELAGEVTLLPGGRFMRAHHD